MTTFDRFQSQSVSGNARTEIRSDLDRHVQVLTDFAEKYTETPDRPAPDDLHLLGIALEVALCALALDAAHTEATHQDVRALDADDPGTPTGAPVPYRSIRALANTERALAQDRWTTTAPTLNATLDRLRHMR